MTFLRTLTLATFLSPLALAAQWSETRLTNSPEESQVPSIVAVGSNVLVAFWTERLNDSIADIYYRRSDDGGQNWSPAQALTDGTAYSTDPYPIIGPNGISMSFSSNAEGNFNFYYTESNDAGLTWVPPVFFFNNPGESKTPKICACGNSMHIFGQDDTYGPLEGHYIHTWDAGLHWNGAEVLSVDADSVYSPQIVCENDEVLVAWVSYWAPGNVPDIITRHSADGGTIWDTETAALPSPGASVNPIIYLMEGRVHMFWTEYVNIPLIPAVFYSYSDNYGGSWSAPYQLDANVSGQDQITMTSVEGVFQTVWSDERDGDSELYYMSSPDAGFTWGNSVRLTQAAGASSHPRITQLNDQLHVVWQDERDGNKEIYYGRYELITGNGHTQANPWQATVLNAAASPALSLEGTATQGVQLNVTDALGRMVYSAKVNIPSVVSLPVLTAGATYFYTMRNGENVLTGKIGY